MKLASLIDNTKSIRKHDPNLYKVILLGGSLDTLDDGQRRVGHPKFCTAFGALRQAP